MVYPPNARVPEPKVPDVVMPPTVKVVVVPLFNVKRLVRITVEMVDVSMPPFPIIVPVPTWLATLIAKVPAVKVRPPENGFVWEKVTVLLGAFMTTAPFPMPERASRIIP